MKKFHKKIIMYSSDYSIVYSSYIRIKEETFFISRKAIDGKTVPILIPQEHIHEMYKFSTKKRDKAKDLLLDILKIIEKEDFIELDMFSHYEDIDNKHFEKRILSKEDIKCYSSFGIIDFQLGINYSRINKLNLNL